MTSVRQEDTGITTRPIPIRVLLVDDHILVRKGIAHLMRSQPDLEVVGESSNGVDALEKAREFAPDVILMDVKMHGGDGMETTRKIKEELPGVQIIALTVSEDEEDLFQAIKSGAQGYLLKNLEPEQLFSAIRNSVKGEAALSPVMATKMLHQFSRHGAAPAQPVLSQLTGREKEVLRFVALGASNGDISARLRLSESTVTNHMHNILKKLHLQSRVQAALYAIDQGILRRGTETHNLVEEVSR
ncbi:MAG: response regulator transcription factor [Dehalococcoidia bacterium]|nr:response regulator transcription factor [Dehalococcoidia bacterium]